MLQPAVVEYHCPFELLLRRDVQNRKFGVLESKVTRATGVLTQTMAIGVGTDLYSTHPNWVRLKVTSRATPEVHADHREWLETYFNGPDWQSEVGIPA
jgi:hypothetical protein